MPTSNIISESKKPKAANIIIYKIYSKFIHIKQVSKTRFPVPSSLNCDKDAGNDLLLHISLMTNKMLIMLDLLCK